LVSDPLVGSGATLSRGLLLRREVLTSKSASSYPPLHGQYNLASPEELMTTGTKFVGTSSTTVLLASSSRPEIDFRFNQEMMFSDDWILLKI
jgi:hypothetical protein